MLGQLFDAALPSPPLFGIPLIQWAFFAAGILLSLCIASTGFRSGFFTVVDRLVGHVSSMSFASTWQSVKSVFSDPATPPKS